MKYLTLAAVMLTVSAVAMALPITGEFDSRTDSSIVVGPYDSGTRVGGFWEDALDSIGTFFAWGASGETQWYIEAQDPEWSGGYYGFIDLNSFGNAPWFGDNAAEVGGYEGLITEWTLNKTYTGEVLDLVLTGTAVLCQKHIMPWYDFGFETMSPVSISFEMGFYGVPDEGYIGGAPSYFVVTIPEPATMSLLAIGALALIRRK